MDRQTLQQRVDIVEAKLEHTRKLLAAAAAVPMLILLGAFAAAPGKPPELVVSKLTIVDDRGIARVVIGEDPKASQRLSRAAGVYLRDKHGFERGGFVTYDDDSVGLAMDAPHGVGASVPDRLGMLVLPSGDPKLLLIGNNARRLVQIRPADDGAGAVDLFRWNGEKAVSRTLTPGGDEKDSKSAVAPIRS